MCMTPVLNKLLTIQLLIQKKVKGIIFDNDAKGCSDRIISGIALACLKRIDYLSNSVRVLVLVWAQLEHHVSTGYGESDKTCSSTLKKLLYGTDQGGGVSNSMGTTKYRSLNLMLLKALGEKFDCNRLVAVYGE
jgi:hypothetical protein